jgi:hypothetical protein
LFATVDIAGESVSLSINNFRMLSHVQRIRDFSGRMFSLLGASGIFGACFLLKNMITNSLLSPNEELWKMNGDQLAKQALDFEINLTQWLNGRQQPDCPVVSEHGLAFSLW